MNNKIEEDLFETIESSLMKKIYGGKLHALATGSCTPSVVVTPSGNHPDDPGDTGCPSEDYTDY